MKNRSILYGFFLSFLVVSCINNHITSNSDRTTSENVAKINRIAEANTVIDTPIPIKDGYVSVVKYGEDTVAVASTPLNIGIPLGYELPDVSNINPSENNSEASFKTKGGSISNYTIDFVKPENIDAENRIYNNWSAIFFEDALNGDMDYNDLIIHVFSTFTKQNTQLTLKVQGIALGSRYILALGVYTKSAGEVFLSDNVRNDIFSPSLLFKETKFSGFINTVKDSLCHFKVGKELTLDVNDYKSEYIVWFIDVYDINKDGSKGRFKYRIWTPSNEKITDENNDDDRVNMFNMYGKPYSFMTRTDNGTFRKYPKETINIAEVYPNFFGWIEGKVDGTFKEAVLKNINDDATKVIHSDYHDSLGQYINIWDHK